MPRILLNGPVGLSDQGGTLVSRSAKEDCVEGSAQHNQY